MNADLELTDDSLAAFRDEVEQFLQSGEMPSPCKGGLNPNFKITEDGITPLMLAVTIGDLDIIKMLLTCKEVDINQTDEQGINSVYIASYYGHVEVLEFLILQGG